MEILEEKYTKAKIYTVGELEPYARAQLQMLCDNECLAGSRARVMPDVHPGKVGTIGLTMTVGQRLMPFLMGIDIGCGVTMVRVRKGKREWDRLDSVIKSRIPAGFASRQKPYDAGYLTPEDLAGRVKVTGRGRTVLQPAVDLLEKAKDFPPEGPILLITDGEIEDRLHIQREHAFLLPRGRRLPFTPRGKVFYFSEA